jgi:hypothetical protein
MIDDNMFDYFYSSLGDTNARDFSRFADAQNGVVGKLHGFTIYTRSSVLAATSANAVKALGAALGTAPITYVLLHGTRTLLPLRLAIKSCSKTRMTPCTTAMCIVLL